MPRYRRRPNGSGHIKKLGGRRRKPWLAETASIYDPDKDRWICKVIGTYETREEVQKALIEYHNHNQDQFRNDTPSLEEIIEIYKRTPLWEGKRQSTKDVYLVSLQVLKPLYSRRLKDLTFRDYEKNFIDQKTTESSAIHVKSILNLIYKYAIRQGYVVDNTAKNIDLHEIGLVKSRRYDKKPWPKESIKKAISDQSSPINDYLMILLYTGLRVREMLSLTVADIHLEDRYLHIGYSKTRNGVRDVPIHKKLIPIFSRLIAGKDPDDLIIITQTGKPYSYQNFNYSYRNYRNKYGLEEECYSIHTTRHTFITRMRELDIDDKYIKAIVGHAEGTVTGDVYSHIGIKKLIESIDKLNY